MSEPSSVDMSQLNYNFNTGDSFAANDRLKIISMLSLALEKILHQHPTSCAADAFRITCAINTLSTKSDLWIDIAYPRSIAPALELAKKILADEGDKKVDKFKF